MNCPACGSDLVEQETDQGTLFLKCQAWGECPIAATPALWNRFAAMRSEIDKLRIRLTESRQQNSELVDKIQAATDSEPHRGTLPVAVGDAFTKLAEYRVKQSQLNAANRGK